MSTRRKATLRLPDYPHRQGSSAVSSGAGYSNAEYSDPLQSGSDCGNIYTDALGSVDTATLDRMRRIKLQDEIVMLRMIMRKVAQQAVEEDTSLKDWLDAMNSLSQTATRLARLLTIELTLVKSEDDSLFMLSRAIHEKMSEAEP